MLGVFAALPAKLGKLEFVRRIKFTALGQIILTFTHSADKRDDDPLFLLSHIGIIP